MAEPGPAAVSRGLGGGGDTDTPGMRGGGGGGGGHREGSGRPLTRLLPQGENGVGGRAVRVGTRRSQVGGGGRKNAPGVTRGGGGAFSRGLLPVLPDRGVLLGVLRPSGLAPQPGAAGRSRPAEGDKRPRAPVPP